MLFRKATVAIVLVVACAYSAATAQPEIVPAEHPVYDYLHLQRIGGHLPQYRHESRPVARSTITALLDSLQIRHNSLSRSSRTWLETFRREFLEPPEHIERVIADRRVRLPRGRDTEKYVYYHRSDNWRVALRGRGTFQFRYGLHPETSGPALVPEIRFEGNYRNRLGFYSGTWNGLQVAGDTRVLQLDPELAPIYYIGRADVPRGNFDRTSASLRVAGRYLSAEIAHQRLIYGAGFRQPLMLGGSADYFPFVRLGVDSRMVQYQFVHGALGDTSRCVFSPEAPDDCVLVGPDRFLAMHRLVFDPVSWLTLAFGEIIIYGNRGPELAYLNPVIPLKPAEHALWDRDSAMFTLEVTARPLNRLELYGTWLVDDLDFSHIGEGSYNNKWAIQTGAGITVANSAIFWTEYTRVEPFVYTHRFELDGYFYNTYHHNGFPLGHRIGPNSDQIAAGIKLWLPGRISAEFDVRYRRKGNNYRLIDGTYVNVGGDLMDGRIPGFHEFTKQFLAGALYSGPGGTFSVRYEPVRGLIFKTFADWQQMAFHEVRALRGRSAPSPAEVQLPMRHDDHFFIRTSISVQF